MKHKATISGEDLLKVTFSALPVGDKVVLVASLDQETFERLCEAGAEFEDFEDDGTLEPTLATPEKDSQKEISWATSRDDGD